MTATAFDPQPAEAARSLVASAPSLELSTDDDGPFDVLGILADRQGAVLLPLPTRLALVTRTHLAGEVPARLTISDPAPLAVRDRVRGQLRMIGWLAPMWPADADRAWAESGCPEPLAADHLLLRLQPELLELTYGPVSRQVTYDVDPDSYARARPDPLATTETEVLQHLATGHPREMAMLAALIPADLRRRADRIVPLRLHRWALVLRVETPDGPHDVAFSLGGQAGPRPPDTAEETLAALRTLLHGCCQG